MCAVGGPECVLLVGCLTVCVLSQVLLDKLGTALHAETAGAVLTTGTNWEDLEIQEEAESGSSVTSKIRLPVQVRVSAAPTHTGSALSLLSVI